MKSSATMQESHSLRLHPAWQKFGRLMYRVLGWRIVGEYPDVPKSVIIIAPHTSNWDFIYAILASFALGIKGQWLGKDTLFVGPLGWLFRHFGGIPVDRSRRHDFVQQAADAFERSTALTLVLTPEGTRHKTDYWKSGFYHVAVAARVPILLGYVDYRTRTAGIGEVMQPTGNVEQDLATIRAFYGKVQARYESCRSSIEFRDKAGG